jgi:hypothetical protein
MTRALAASLSLVSCLTLSAPAVTLAQPSCLTFNKVAPANELAAQLDVAYVLEVTPDGRTALEKMRLAYVRIEYQGTGASAGAASAESTPGATKPGFVRLLESPTAGDPARQKDPLATRFTFSREGLYTLQLRRAADFGWPHKDGTGEPAPGCALQQVRVKAGPRIGDFSGTSAQWWLAYRPATRLEAGGSIFFKRFGLAVSVEGNVPRFFGDRDDPKNFNPVTLATEVRWRGARGYLGGSMRYFPDEEEGLDQYRFGFVAGEELPSFKGLPIWLVADLRLNDPQAEFWRELSFSLAFRFDMPGSRP